MSKPKLSANLILAFLSILVLNSSASAQSNLTAKANSFQPQPVSVAVESDRVKDGLAGPVRRVRTEVAKLLNANGRPAEDKRVVLETASYDIKGGKTENQYFPGGRLRADRQGSLQVRRQGKHQRDDFAQ